VARPSYKRKAFRKTWFFRHACGVTSSGVSHSRLNQPLVYPCILCCFLLFLKIKLLTRNGFGYTWTRRDSHLGFSFCSFSVPKVFKEGIVHLPSWKVLSLFTPTQNWKNTDVFPIFPLKKLKRISYKDLGFVWPSSIRKRHELSPLPWPILFTSVRGKTLKK